MAVAQRPGGALGAPAPPPVEAGVIRQLYADWAAERRAGAREGLPPGTLRPSLSVMRRTFSDPLGLLLEHRRRYGPVFTIRHGPQAVVWAIGATANHQMLVTEADAFSWREGRFVDLWPLLGDGLLNIDGPFHDGTARRLLVPAFHHDRVAAVADTMVAEGVAAVERLVPGRRSTSTPGRGGWRCGSRCGRCWGSSVAGDDEHALADAFERALDFHGLAVPLQMMRGPGTPHARVLRARAELDRRLFDEIRARRRARRSGRRGARPAARLHRRRRAPLDEAIVRDQTTTLLFAGHDTTTATLTFLGYELARNPAAAAAVQGRAGLGRSAIATRAHPSSTAGRCRCSSARSTRRCACTRRPGSDRGAAPRPVVIDGMPLPAGVGVQYSSWATHHLEELYPVARALRSRSLPARRPRRAAAQGRLHPVRRRDPDLHRQALRPVRAARAGRGAAATAAASSSRPASACRSRSPRPWAPRTDCASSRGAARSRPVDRAAPGAQSITRTILPSLPPAWKRS